MRKVYVTAGLLAVALAATVAVAEARGPAAGAQNWGQGVMMRLQAPATVTPGGMMGAGMMGRGMMGRGAAGQMDCQAAESYDPAAMLEHTQAMLEQHAASLTDLNTRLAEAKTDKLKAAITTRIEHLSIMNGWLQSRIPVLQALPEDQTEGLKLLARHDVQYFQGVTVTDPFNQNWVAQRLARAEELLAALEAN